MMKPFLILILFITSVFFVCCNQADEESAGSPTCITCKDEAGEDTSRHLVTAGTVEAIVKQIGSDNRVSTDHTGIAGSSSAQWNFYLQLKQTASPEQLLELTDHKNGAVRCYAFYALAAKKSGKVFPVLLNHLHDTETVSTQTGCIGRTEMVGDYFLNLVTPNSIDPDLYKLSSSERRTVDSILVNDNTISLYAKSLVLHDLLPTTENYRRIKELVVRERNVSALITLAKYRKSDDRTLIASFFAEDDTEYNALFAAREFSDAYFYPYVKKVFEQEWKKENYDYPKWRMCFQALAKYPGAETLALFERTIGSKDEFRHNTLCTNLLTAITKYPNTLFEPLKKKIILPEEYRSDVTQQLSYEDEK